jgi:2,5-furandicarboxylate decarboxylase 1
VLHHDLRSFLAYLGERRDLATIQREVDPNYEIAAYIRKSSDVERPTFLFDNVRGSDMRVAGGVVCSPNKAVHALMAREQREATQMFSDGLANPIDPVLVVPGPCQEVVLEGADVDLTRPPIPGASSILRPRASSAPR